MMHLSHLGTNLKNSVAEEIAPLNSRPFTNNHFHFLPPAHYAPGESVTCLHYVRPDFACYWVRWFSIVTRANVNSVETDHHFTRTHKIRQQTVRVTELHHYAVNYNSVVPTPAAHTNVFSTAQGQQEQKAGNYRNVCLCIHTLPNTGLC